jgi:hypothetical protein
MLIHSFGNLIFINEMRNTYKTIIYIYQNKTMANSSPPQQLLTCKLIFKLHYIKLSFSIQLIVLDFEICHFSKIIVFFSFLYRS